MNYRTLGKTGFNVSEISLGTWQVGGTWGSGFDHDLASKLLHKAHDKGVNFIDTADVYEAGESEKAVGKFVNSVSDRIYVATKCGRQINPHINEGYTPKVLRGYVEDSLKRMNLETLDLIQLHCPPTEVYYRPEIFGEFEKLKEEGKIQNLGVSVEKVEEALKAIEYENVTTVQIIYNMFRQRPDDLFYQRAKEKNVGVIVRVPLASGLLTGKYTKDTTFEDGDHRHGNRNGEWFDKGETFAGVPYETGVEAVNKIRKLFPDQKNLAQIALRWILMNDKISVVIPGASKEYQVDSNMEAADLPAISQEKMEAVKEIYESDIKPHVHHLW
jgi:aryl-alcohol dehydrogenase-like predicted oxidoreductase